MAWQTGTKKLFKRYCGYYKSGRMQPDFLEKVYDHMERSSMDPVSDARSWEDWCKENYGVVFQPDLQD